MSAEGSDTEFLASTWVTDMDPSATPDPPEYSEAKPRTEPEDLLDPTLKFDMDTLIANLHKADKAFAREVVKLISKRGENGIFACDSWGYRFSETQVPCSQAVS